MYSGKSHADMLILVRAVEAMLIKRRKKVSQQRILAFTKRLATLALQVLHNGSLSCLGHIKSVLQVSQTLEDTSFTLSSRGYFFTLQGTNYVKICFS